MAANSAQVDSSRSDCARLAEPMATIYERLTLPPIRSPGTTSLFPGETRRTKETSPPSASVQVHALSAGHFSLPEEQFVSPSTPGSRHSVPSLCFLIQHVCSVTNHKTRILFDLGLRRDVKRYPPPIQHHLISREPFTTTPDVVTSLKAGGLTPDDIDHVVYSHVCFMSIAIPVHSLTWPVIGSLGSCWRATGLHLQHFRRRPRLPRRAARQDGWVSREPFAFRVELA